MSIEARNWAWALDVPPSRKLVALALAEHANNHRECWPSISRLEQFTGLARSTVADALADLESRRLISRNTGGPGRSTHYHLGLNGNPTDGTSNPVCNQVTGRSDSPTAELPGSPTAGPSDDQVVRQPDQGSPVAGPDSPTAGLAVVRQPDPNRKLNRKEPERNRQSACTRANGSGDAQKDGGERQAKKSGATIPADWKPSGRVIAWAEKQGMPAQWVEDQVDEFVVYWTDRSEARKSWDATFMNRLRTLHEQRSVDNRRGNNGPDSNHVGKDYAAGATPIDAIPWMHGRAIG